MTRINKYISYSVWHSKNTSGQIIIKFYISIILPAPILECISDTISCNKESYTEVAAENKGIEYIIDLLKNHKERALLSCQDPNSKIQIRSEFNKNITDVYDHWVHFLTNIPIGKPTCNCCNEEIKENPIEDKWSGYICQNCASQEL